MERSVASMALLASGIFFGLMVSGWWLERMIFTPNDTAATAVAVLSDASIRGGLIVLIAGFAASAIGTTSSELSSFLENEVLTRPAGAAELALPIGRIHRLVIGDTSEQVVLTGSDLVTVVRDQRVVLIPDIVLPIDTIGTLQTVNTIVGWMVPICGGLGLLCLLAGLFFRPERGDLMQVLSESLVAFGISMVLLGYLVPVYLLPAIDNLTWIAIAPQLATANAEFTLGAAALSIIAGVVLWLYRRGATPRRQWSRPLSATRYSSGDNPGWSG